MSLILTDKNIEFMAQRANWKFDVDFRTPFGDPVTFEGDGVDDLNRLIARVSESAVRLPKILCDTGALFSNWVIVSVNDIMALRDRYIEIHGTVDKPQEPFEIPNGVAVEVSTK